jgi:kumamolisin
VQAVVAFKPRNRVLLDWMAAHSSGRPGLSEARIRQLFAPTPAAVASVRSYLAANGLVVTDSSDMSLVVSGTVSAAQRAFGTSIDVYRDRRGRSFQAPAGDVRLPAAVAGGIQSVAGLDTSLRAQPHYVISHHRRAGAAAAGPVAASVSGCNSAQNTQNTFGGYLPSDLAAAYHFDSLLAGNNDGTGETIGLVEFSSYHAGDVTTFQNCFNGITGTRGVDVHVGTSTPGFASQAEVALDFDVAMGAAPDATWTAYIAGNNLALGPTMWNKMRADGVNIVSDSWGLCELLVPPKLTSTENVSLEMAAVAGMSFYSATGDFGSAACFPSTGQSFLNVDDPSGQPYATGVGGTRLLTAPLAGGRTETGWNGSGGGISIDWPKPAYQRGHTLSVPGYWCAGGTSQCREVPDVAMDAAPTTGYVIFSHGVSGSSGVWTVVAGTSGAAPLMAGITADADESAGQNLGFANPFIYSEPAGTFYDPVSGNNCRTGCPSYTARAGYDLVTGRGAVHADTFAADLASYTAGPIVFHPSTLAIAHPLRGAKVKKGTRVTFRGTLRDSTAHTAIANGQVLLITSKGRIFGVARTTSTGAWSFTFKVSATFGWHATYMGSDTHRRAVTPTRTIYAT